MARTKEFDESQVLDRALEMFRSRGFKATSFTDLTAALGVNRQSLYDTYGDKEALFLAALKRYLESSAKGLRKHLADPAPVQQVLEALFAHWIRQHSENATPGCLLVNTVVELAPTEAAHALATSHARYVESLLARRLALAQQSGEIGPEENPEILARFFHHTLLGIAVAARAHEKPERLLQTARSALRILG